jgi:tartrate/fumarate subfamily iron-sulfur-dependent hydro-lyase alpha chain
MRNLKANLLELIRRTSAELPDDVVEAIGRYSKQEQPGSNAQYAMSIIRQNIDMAKLKSAPLCQDTGSILFFVQAPKDFDQLAFEKAAATAVAEATAKGYLRQNSVDSITGKNTGNNLGPGSPSLHFHQHRGTRLDVRLILKGGGCENVGTQYSLPDTRLHANRDLTGVRTVILDAVLQAQGKGCGPGILGVCIGGDRATGYLHSKEQLLRMMDDVNPDSSLATLEKDIVASSNKLGIGPMGFGGATTLLGCKIGARNRLPASFFVSISYMCWAYRRQGFVLNNDGKILKWLY